MLPFETPTYSVSDLGQEIREFLGEGFRILWVQGEVHRAHLSRNGHLYFELVEKGEGDRLVARLDCVVWRGNRERLQRRAAGESILDEGREVRCQVQVDFYVTGGRLQLVVRDLDPEYTLGRLALRRKETLEALRLAGLLERNQGLSLPAVPLEIGLVTSHGSAAYHDFLGSLSESGYGFRLLFVHASVQGAAAEAEISSALRLLGQRPLDACALIRGGGSRSDLAAFDARSIAEAVATAPFPVLSGLGHEIDQSVTDLVAHTALRTPTKVAEFLVDRVAGAELRYLQAAREASHLARSRLDRESSRLGALEERLRGAGRWLRSGTERLEALARGLATAARRSVRDSGEHQASLRARLATSSGFRLAAARTVRREQGRRLLGATQALLRTRSVELDGRARLIAQLAPQRTLERGFSITLDPAGRPLRSAAAVEPGDRLRTRLADGEVTSRVETP